MFRLYSRPIGWLNDEPIKYFYSEIIYDHNNEIVKNNIINKSGRDIINNYNINNEKLIELAKIYPEWHLYKINTLITSQDSL